MSEPQVGDLLNMTDSGMYLAGEVRTVRPTLFGPRYLLRVLWNNDTYTNCWRMWWRVWR